LTPVLRAAPPRDVSGPLEAREIATRGRRIDAEPEREGGRGDDAAIGDELKGLGLLRGDVRGRAGALASEPSQTSRDKLKGS
jgi:hypothetical protein